MHGRKHLFIALSRKGWGETSLGVEVARQVREAGGEVAFMAHSGGIPALAGTGFAVQEIPDHMVPLFEMLLDARLAEQRFDSMILCDYMTTNYTLSQSGADPTRLLGYDLPIIALDTWEYALTGTTIDTFGANQWHTGTWIEQLEHRIIPAPIGRLTAPGAYCGLPPQLELPRSVRRHIRNNLGLQNSDRAVLFCTAGWQHNIKDPDGERLSKAVPRLLWNYLGTIDQAIRLIHVGPSELSLSETGDRYLWMPSVSPRDFDRLLGSVDLFLSANISATTIGRAIVSGVPTVVVRNSHYAKTPAEAESAAGGEISSDLTEWLRTTVPLYPFSLWPLGHWHFLKPLLDANPYSDSLNVVELLDEVAFVETCRRLLFEGTAREEATARQTEYVAQVRKLPGAVQMIDACLQ
jgi:hypothetical protein